MCVSGLTICTSPRPAASLKQFFKRWVVFFKRHWFSPKFCGSGLILLLFLARGSIHLPWTSWVSLVCWIIRAKWQSMLNCNLFCQCCLRPHCKLFTGKLPVNGLTLCRCVYIISRIQKGLGIVPIFVSCNNELQQLALVGRFSHPSDFESLDTD